MKELIISLGLLASAAVGYSQGVINWADFVGPAGFDPGWSITIWGVGSETPGGGSAPNNTSVNDLPAGTATYTGAALSGAAFEVGLYVDTTALAVAADVSSGMPIATSTFQTGGNAGTWYTGSSLQAQDHSIAPGTPVNVELAAWSTADGASTYAIALSQGVVTGLSGASTGTTVLGGGSPPVTPGTLDGTGIQDFALTTTIPEPGTIALGLIVASTFLLRFRRR